MHRRPNRCCRTCSTRLSTAPLDSSVRSELANYLQATGPWTASAAQLQAKVPGLVHLVAATAEYQFV